jgi:hypothetical protein
MLSEFINYILSLISSVSGENLQNLALLVLAISVWILALRVKAISKLNGIRDLLAAKKLNRKNKKQ